ncbi:MAG: hypothetical protein HRU20_20530 [Pseudomonadales bacterium]|nr:hypothetical protein [Pseudomonadales bacterium]
MSSIDLSCTTDPEWIAQREKLWVPVEKELKVDCTKKYIQQFRVYFFTGELNPELEINILMRLQMFPRFDLESIQFVLQNLVRHEESDKTYYAVIGLFKSYLPSVPGMTTEKSKDMFIYVFGETYDPERCLPFLIVYEKSYRRIETNPTDEFVGFCSLMYLYTRKESSYINYRPLIPKYWLSIFPYVDTKLFTINPKSSDSIDGVGSLELFGGMIKLFLHCFFEYPNRKIRISDESLLQQRKLWLQQTKALILEGGDKYPDKFWELWHHVEKNGPK